MYCGQMAEWIKMPLGTELGLGSGDIVLHEDSVPLPKSGVLWHIISALFSCVHVP